jgi:hypothetical protein
VLVAVVASSEYVPLSFHRTVTHDTVLEMILMLSPHGLLITFHGSLDLTNLFLSRVEVGIATLAAIVSFAVRRDYASS